MSLEELQLNISFLREWRNKERSRDETNNVHISVCVCVYEHAKTDMLIIFPFSLFYFNLSITMSFYIKVSEFITLLKLQVVYSLIKVLISWY